MNVAEWLARSGRRYPGHPALFSGKSSSRIITALRGVRPPSARDCASNLASRPATGWRYSPGIRLAYLEAMFGAWFAGAAIVPINAKLHPKEAAYIIANSGASLVFSTAPLGEELGLVVVPGRLAPSLIDLDSAAFDLLRQSEPLAAPVERASSDMAWLFYTSGTTG